MHILLLNIVNIIIIIYLIIIIIYYIFCLDVNFKFFLKTTCFNESLKNKLI